MMVESQFGMKTVHDRIEIETFRDHLSLNEKQLVGSAHYSRNVQTLLKLLDSAVLKYSAESH